MRKWAAALLAVLLLTIISGCVPDPYLSETTQQQSKYSPIGDGLELHFIDVGQGDCTLLRTDKVAMLIDAGTGESRDKIFSYLDSLGITKLDYFIGTHPHEDHLGSAAAVIDKYGADEVFMSEQMSGSYFFERLLDTLLEKEIEVTLPKMDCVYKTEDFSFKFLTDGTAFSNLNDNSLCVMVTYKNQKMLFMGDAEKAVERKLIENGEDLSAGVLKVGHHGSRYSSESAFLEEVAPTVSIIPCGEGNVYGHPHDEAVKRLEVTGCKIYRTDLEGDIVITADGTRLYDKNGEVLTKGTAKKTVYIGNRKSKKLHREDCSGKPSVQNSVFFNDRDKAISYGYSPCANCNP